MRILLDNCVPYRAKRLFEGHDVQHTTDLSWEELSNGRLLAAAAGERFDVMLTVDKKIKFEQNLDRLPLTVIEIDTSDSRFAAIEIIAIQLHDAMKFVNRFRFISIDRNGIITSQSKREAQ